MTALSAVNRAEGTIRLHRSYVRRLADRFDDPWHVSTRQLRAVLGTPGWSAETKKSARMVFRGFYRWAHGIGYVDDDPALDLDAVKVPAGVPRPAPEELVDALTRGADKRVARMAMLAAYCGLRAGEIARVHSSDLVGDELLVHGKGGKQRAVPVLEPRLLMWLRNLDGWAFPNGRGSHLRPARVTYLVSRALPEGWTAHTLRHRCGTVAYAGTRDLLAVQALLGHARPETTQRYVRLPQDAVRAAVAAATA